MYSNRSHSKAYRRQVAKINTDILDRNPIPIDNEYIEIKAIVKYP